MQDLNKKMTHGVLWMGLLRLSVRFIGLVSTVILARILVPEDFGLVAMATSILAFLQLAAAFSFDIPLIQNQDSGRDDFNSAWTLNILLYGSLAVLLILLAEPASRFYQEERLTSIIHVLAIGFFLQGFENIGIVYFRKELNFKKDFVLMVSKKLLAFAVTIPLAIFTKSYWALVIGIVIGNVGGVGLSYIMHPYRPRLALLAARKLLGFSKWLMVNNVVNFLRNRSPDFVVGRLAGTSALGLFTIGFEISTLPTTELVSPINRAVFPGYAKLASDVNALRQSYLDVLGLTALIALPAGFGLAAMSKEVVLLFLGEKWIQASAIVAVGAIYGGINAIQTNTGSVFNAMGKPFLITYIGIANVAILLSCSIPLAIKYGPLGVAYAFLLTTLVIGPLTFAVVCRELSLPPQQLIQTIINPMLASCLMYGCVVGAKNIVVPNWNIGNTAEVLLLTFVGVVVYTVLISVSWILRGRPRGSEIHLFRFACSKFR